MLNEIGFALMLIGLPFGTAIRNVYPKLELVQLIFALSFLFIVNYRNLFRFIFPSYNKYFTYIFLFNFISFLYLLLFPSHYQSLNKQIIVMQLYIFAVIIALSTLNRNLNLINLDRYLFYISGFITLVILYQVTRGFTGIYLENVFADSTLKTNRMEHGGDKTTMGRALFLCFITAIVYKSKNNIETLIKPILIVSVFLGLYMFNTRASIVVCLLSLLIYFWKKHQIGIGIFHKRNSIIIYTFVAIILIFFSVYLYQSNIYFYTMINVMIENIFNGLSSFFGSSKTDESALIRKGNMIYFQNAMNDLNPFQLLFGRGFIVRFIDVPFMQAFLDLGLFGFFFYTISLIYLPLKFIFVKLTSISHIIIIQLFAFHYLVDQLYAGMPYWSLQFMPIILLVFLYSNNRKQYIKIKKTSKK
ncbi:MAG: hypothetical protein PHR83_17100 [Paludibacter sp.]|nr:hypothetical protein [Paludibacter sp.]